MFSSLASPFRSATNSDFASLFAEVLEKSLKTFTLVAHWISALKREGQAERKHQMGVTASQFLTNFDSTSKWTSEKDDIHLVRLKS